MNEYCENHFHGRQEGAGNVTVSSPHTLLSSNFRVYNIMPSILDCTDKYCLQYPHARMYHPKHVNCTDLLYVFIVVVVENHGVLFTSISAAVNNMCMVRIISTVCPKKHLNDPKKYQMTWDILNGA